MVVVLLVIGFLIPVTIPRAFTSPDGEYQNIRTIHIIAVLCTCKYIGLGHSPDFSLPSMIWAMVLYLYLAVLQVNMKLMTAALVLALRIRNVKIRVVNDSKEIAAMVYLTTIAVLESSWACASRQPYPDSFECRASYASC